MNEQGVWIALDQMKKTIEHVRSEVAAMHATLQRIEEMFVGPDPTGFDLEDRESPGRL